MRLLFRFWRISRKSASNLSVMWRKGTDSLAAGFFNSTNLSNLSGKWFNYFRSMRPCSGTGRTQKTKSLMVKIPKGVDDGSRIRLSGEGEAGLNGGQQGDLYIFVNVNEHEIFARENENLFAEVQYLWSMLLLALLTYRQ